MLIKKIKAGIPMSIKRFINPIRWAIIARLHDPKYLKIGDTEIALKARNWPFHIAIMNSRIESGRLFLEWEATKPVLEMMKGKKVFYDIGATTGYYSFLAAGHGIKKVFAFEPSEPQAKFAKKEAERLSMDIFVEMRPLGKRGQKILLANNFEYIWKNAVSIDDFVHETGLYPDLLKIDVEGYEADVIEGGWETIKTKKPDMILELHPQYMTKLGRSSEELLLRLQELGYKEIYPRIKPDRNEISPLLFLSCVSEK